jgi:CHAD domain-containing protein
MGAGADRTPLNRAAFLAREGRTIARARLATGRSAPLASSLKTLADTAAASVDGLIGDASPSIERIHDLHREMRRLRVGLELWSRLVPARDRESMRTLIRRVKRLAGLIGQVRDRDVVLELLERTRRVGSGAPESRTFHRFWVRLRDDSRVGRELLRAFLRTEREAGLFRSVADAIGRTPRSATPAAVGRLIAEENRAREERFRRAHRRARRRPTSVRLHRLRIRLRQWRHVAEITGTVAAGAARPIPPSFRRLQDRLGRLHDLDVALATLDPDLDGSPWAARLRQERRGSRTAARLQLDRLVLPPPRPPGAAPAPRRSAR